MLWIILPDMSSQWRLDNEERIKIRHSVTPPLFGSRRTAEGFTARSYGAVDIIHALARLMLELQNNTLFFPVAKNKPNTE